MLLGALVFILKNYVQQEQLQEEKQREQRRKEEEQEREKEAQALAQKMAALDLNPGDDWISKSLGAVSYSILRENIFMNVKKIFKSMEHTKDVERRKMKLTKGVREEVGYKYSPYL